MPPVKSSKAVYKTARLNPVTSQADRDVLEIVERLEAEGWNFKQIAVDAILRADGRTPEIYDKPGLSMNALEPLLEQFAKEIISEIRRSGISTSKPGADSETDESEVTPFSRTFAKSFVQRQQRTMGDDE